MSFVVGLILGFTQFLAQNGLGYVVQPILDIQLVIFRKTNFYRPLQFPSFLLITLIFNCNIFLIWNFHINYNYYNIFLFDYIFSLSHSYHAIKFHFFFLIYFYLFPLYFDFF